MSTQQPETQKEQKCRRCAGSGRYVVGPIVNGYGRDLGACYRCGGTGIDPKQPKRKAQ